MNAEASSFDPSQFLDATTTEALVRRPPLPVGDYLAVVGEPVSRSWTSQKPDARVKSGIAIDLPLVIDVTLYSAAHAVVGVDTVTLKAGIMLDLNESGAIDWGMGKNGALRRYREALGMNEAGKPFSIRQMQGRIIKVKVKHRPYEGEFYEEVDSVAKP